MSREISLCLKRLIAQELNVKQKDVDMWKRLIDLAGGKKRRINNLFRAVESRYKIKMTETNIEQILLVADLFEFTTFVLLSEEIKKNLKNRRHRWK